MESDSDSDSDVEQSTRNLSEQAREAEVGNDDDDDDGMQTGVGCALRTKNEVDEAIVRVPDVSEVDMNEILERVGEIMSIIDNIVIVKGLPSEYLNRPSDRALDSESLLVFDDRKVLGYVRKVRTELITPCLTALRYMRLLVQHRSRCTRSNFLMPT